MNEKNRVTDCRDISIDEEGRWFYRDKPITNQDILSYFKRNLHRDATGYFIKNSFGPRVELGYLGPVRGFPLRVVSFDFSGDGERPRALLDSGETFTPSLSELRLLDEETLLLFLPAQGVWARLAAQAMTDLMDLLDEKDGRYLVLIKGEPREIERVRKEPDDSDFFFRAR